MRADAKKGVRAMDVQTRSLAGVQASGIIVSETSLVGRPGGAMIREDSWD